MFNTLLSVSFKIYRNGRAMVNTEHRIDLASYQMFIELFYSITTYICTALPVISHNFFKAPYNTVYYYLISDQLAAQYFMINQQTGAISVSKDLRNDGSSQYYVSSAYCLLGLFVLN